MVSTTTSGLPAGCHRFKQRLFRFGQIKAGSVAAFEAIFVDLHLLAFEFAGNPNNGDYHIRCFAAAISLGLGWRSTLDQTRRANASDLSSGAVLDMKFGRLAGFEMNVADLGLDAICLPGGRYILAIDLMRKNPSAASPRLYSPVSGAVRSPPIEWREDERCRLPPAAVRRRRQFRARCGWPAASAHRGIHVAHIELGVAGLDARLAINSERGAGHRHGMVAKELRSWNVLDGSAGKLVAETLKHRNGVRGDSVVVAQQHLGLVGQRADDSYLDAGSSSVEARRRS